MLSFWTVVKRSVCSRRGCYMNVLWRCTCRQESGSLTPWRREILLWGQVHRGYSHHQLSQKLHRERIVGTFAFHQTFCNTLLSNPYRADKNGALSKSHQVEEGRVEWGRAFYISPNCKSLEVLSCIDLVARFTLSDGDILEDYCSERSGKDLIKI